MTVRQRPVARVATALVLVLALGALTPAYADGPRATKWQSSLTAPTGSSASIRITKSSKVQVKIAKGYVTFVLKLNGVLDGSDQLVNLTNNTFQVDLLIAGISSTKNFIFDLVGGKTVGTLKFPIDNGTLGVSAGDPIEVKTARVLEFGSGERFGVSGVTAK